MQKPEVTIEFVKQNLSVANSSGQIELDSIRNRAAAYAAPLFTRQGKPLSNDADAASAAYWAANWLAKGCVNEASKKVKEYEELTK